MKKLIIILTISLSSYFVCGQIINIPADFETIQFGINAANNGDTILVDTGLYIENIDFSGKNIKVLSHFVFSMDTNFILQTIIDGDSAGSVVSIINGEDSTTQLIGFTIRNGADTLGGGIKIINSNIKISNCIFTQNIAYRRGAGIYSYNSNPYITYSSISHNNFFFEGWGEVQGSGIYLSNSGGAITNSDIIYNGCPSHTNSAGGGIYYENCSTELENLLIAYNCARFFAGLYLLPAATSSVIYKNLKIVGNSASSFGGFASGKFSNSQYPTTILNSIFEDNHTSNGGSGISCSGGNHIFINCTIINNIGGKGGLYVYNETNVYLNNAILSNNSPSELYIKFYEPYDPVGEAFLSYCNLYPNGISGEEYNVHFVEGNIDSDPLFIETGEYPYMLSDDSPCVNTGTEDTTGLNLPEFDLIGNYRIYGGRIDMGAYENQNVSVGIAEFEDDNFSIEPNPFRNETFIRCVSSKKNILKIDLYDINGRRIKSISSGLTISENDKIPINTVGLEKGIYIVLITTDEAIISKKLIKE